ncbi:hypothetical protein ABEB36_015814 [Hypothenemus hampei]|uniref:Uncharacterized protein n=1 Tax=Hypothenemus hampei TaxID=57062 RepID=A0ABD1DYZ4_HYPHA
MHVLCSMSKNSKVDTDQGRLGRPRSGLALGVKTGPASSSAKYSGPKGMDDQVPQGLATGPNFEDILNQSGQTGRGSEGDSSNFFSLHDSNATSNTNLSYDPNAINDSPIKELSTEADRVRSSTPIDTDDSNDSVDARANSQPEGPQTECTMLTMQQSHSTYTPTKKDEGNENSLRSLAMQAKTAALDVQSMLSTMNDESSNTSALEAVGKKRARENTPTPPRVSFSINKNKKKKNKNVYFTSKAMPTAGTVPTRQSLKRLIIRICDRVGTLEKIIAQSYNPRGDLKNTVLGLAEMVERIRSGSYLNLLDEVIENSNETRELLPLPEKRVDGQSENKNKIKLIEDELRETKMQLNAIKQENIKLKDKNTNEHNIIYILDCSDKNSKELNNLRSQQLPINKALEPGQLSNGKLLYSITTGNLMDVDTGETIKAGGTTFIIGASQDSVNLDTLFKNLTHAKEIVTKQSSKDGLEIYCGVKHSEYVRKTAEYVFRGGDRTIHIVNKYQPEPEAGNQTKNTIYRDTIIVKKDDSTTYADALRKVQKEINLKDYGAFDHRVSQNKNGDIMLKVATRIGADF